MTTNRMDRQSVRVLLCTLAAAALLGGLARPAGAQATSGRDVYQEQIRVRLDQQLPAAREMGLDAGGWFSFAFFNYDDAGARKKRTLRQYELRGWGSVNIQGVHRFYVRGLLGYDDWNSGDNPREFHGDQYSGLEIERAWYQFDLGRLLQNQTGQEPLLNFRVKAGRAFAEMGTALVLSMPLDMVQFDVGVGAWEFMALLGKTVEHTRNLDDSDAVASHQDRCLWGMQLTYTGFDRHRPFVYFLSNEDDTDPRPRDPFQSYSYSSRYVGVGSEGALLLPDLRYQVEVVGEFGKTYSGGVTAGRDSICAMATDVLLEYLFRLPTRPKITYEYLWGSGDQDRLLSATTTVLGNRRGTNDNAFNAFGFRDTGLAFAPRVSNLHVHTLGASFFPLEQHKLFERMEVGTKVFFYHKSTAPGPISDSTGPSNARWIGWEWDVYCNWRLTSDLSWTIRYGAFMPSGAFSDDSCRQFLLTAVILSF